MTTSSTCNPYTRMLPTATNIIVSGQYDDDDDFGTVNLPFPVSIYGNSSSTIFLSTNGVSQLLPICTYPHFSPCQSLFAITVMIPADSSCSSSPL